jgi:uncharacterized protein
MRSPLAASGRPIPPLPFRGPALGGAACLLAVFLAGLLAPVRHRVVLEADPANPVQCLRLESRSLLGLARPAWGARVLGGTEVWGSAREGFFLSPNRAVEVTVRAWPGWSRSFEVTPVPAGQDGVSSPGLQLDEGDGEAFRAWFVAILERQLDGPSPAWEPAQRDCAGLLRFAFREAWGPHDAAWRDRTGFAGPPVAGDPSAALGGPWRRAFPTPDGWAPFARGLWLRRLACVALGREMALGRPGDLIFFARGGAHARPDHAMAFVRPDADGQPVLLYHTGAEGTGAGRQEGEVRRVRLDDLLHHPDPEFRPLAENPAFLGVHRWRVLAREGAGPLEEAGSSVRLARPASPLPPPHPVRP